MIPDVRCVRTARLGSPNTALLPYKMGATLQRLIAVRGMGRDPQRREMGDAGPSARYWQRRSDPESNGGAVRQTDDEPVKRWQRSAWLLGTMEGQVRVRFGESRWIIELRPRRIPIKISHESSLKTPRPSP